MTLAFPIESEEPEPIPWAVKDVVVEASRRVKMLAVLTPVEAQRERGRLVGELVAGRRPSPRWTYAPRPLTSLRRALDAAEDFMASRTSSGSPGIESLYAARLRELSIEAAICGSAGTPQVAALARERYPAPAPAVAAAASVLGARWLREQPSGPPEALVESDSADPRSLLSLMRDAVGRLRLPFRVTASPSLAPLAAIGESTILVATGRALPEADAVRTVLHEIEGHALPRARAARAGSILFAAGTARGVDDQEGRALVLEERAGHLGPRRRRQIAARHWAVDAMLAGAAFGDVAWELRHDHGLDAVEAVVIAERAFRGGDGSHPGLGRERVYLEAFVRVRAHLTARPEDESVLACGQVALDAIDTLRPLAGERG